MAMFLTFCFIIFGLLILNQQGDYMRLMREEEKRRKEEMRNNRGA